MTGAMDISMSMYKLLLVVGLMLISGPSCFVDSFQRSMNSMASHSRYTRLNLAMNKDMMKFGNKFDIVVKMPTKDFALAEKFLKDPTELVEGLWDKKKYTLVDKDMFLLKMQELALPGIDTISPEMEVKFANDDGTVSMESAHWSLKGSSKVLKDSRFMQTFDIKLKGQLDLRQEGGKPVEAYGWVSFDVEGEKPGILKAAPDFLLDSVINIIKESSRDFAVNDFSRKFLKSFRRYMLSAVQNSEVEVEK